MKREKKSSRSIRVGKGGANRKGRSAVSFSPALYKAVMNRPVTNTELTEGDFDRIMRYVIMKESPDDTAYKENPLTSEEIDVIEKNCRDNKEWSNIKADLEDEYHNLLETIRQSSFSQLSSAADRRPALSKFRLLLHPFSLLPQSRIPRFALVFASALVIVFGLLASISLIVTPGYYEGTTIEPATFTSRGESNVLGLGLEALHRRDYTVAHGFFHRTIQENPHSEAAFFASYLSGSVHLISARRNFLGLFLSFDQAQVDSGMVELSYVLEGVRTLEKGRFLEEQCRFALGQAYLMKGDISDARQEFERVIQLNGVKNHESVKILSFLPPQ
jgi:hypothetical protein